MQISLAKAKTWAAVWEEAGPTMTNAGTMDGLDGPDLASVENRWRKAAGLNQQKISG